MNDLLTKVESLEAWSTRQESRTRRTLMWTSIVYGVLIVFVTAYTLAIVPIFKELTSPTALGERAHAWLQTELPAQRRALVGYCMDSSPVWANTGVTLIKEAVPALENHIQTILDTYTASLTEALKREIVPELTKALTQHAPEVKAKYAELKKANNQQEIPATLATLLGAEMDNYLNDEFVGATEKLQVQLRELATTPTSKLTRREDAQRRALSAWAVLSEHGEVGESVLTELLEKANRLFLNYFSSDAPVTTEE